MTSSRLKPSDLLRREELLELSKCVICLPLGLRIPDRGMVLERSKGLCQRHFATKSFSSLKGATVIRSSM